MKHPKIVTRPSRQAYWHQRNNAKQKQLEAPLNQHFATMLRIAGSLSFKTALALVDVRVLDHLIVAGADVTSLAERGLV